LIWAFFLPRADISQDHGRLEVMGAGGTAKVYKGSYRGESVAVKLVYPPELTQEEVSGFLQEAAVLAQAGSHPNLVHTMGVCVMPPSIALVLEVSGTPPPRPAAAPPRRRPAPPRPGRGAITD
jgi:hypothetical protein